MITSKSLYVKRHHKRKKTRILGKRRKLAKNEKKKKRASLTRFCGNIVAINCILVFTISME